MTYDDLQRLNALKEENRSLKQENRSLKILLECANAVNPVQRGLPSPFAVFAESN